MPYDNLGEYFGDRQDTNFLMLYLPQVIRNNNLLKQCKL